MYEMALLIFGAVIGVIIKELLWQSYKDRKNRKIKLNQINEELRANYHQISQKKDLLKKVISWLERFQFLPGTSVGFVSIYYDNFLPEVYPYLNSLERNSLHVIFQILKSTDSIMNSFEKDILYYLSNNNNLMKSQTKVYEMFAGRMRECLNNLDVVEELIQKHLSNEPVDVFYVKMGDNKPERYS